MTTMGMDSDITRRVGSRAGASPKPSAPIRNYSDSSPGSLGNLPPLVVGRDVAREVSEQVIPCGSHRLLLLGEGELEAFESGCPHGVSERQAKRRGSRGPFLPTRHHTQRVRQE